MLKRLETTYGVRGTVLDWFVSYLSDRSQSVIFDGVVSASRTFVYGVPQGSVLGPVLFTFYFQLLSDVISDHICDYHKYADDTELSKNAPPDHFVYVQSCIQTYIDDILLWMNSNNLKLNTDKTEVMPVDCTSRLKSVDSECANIGGNTVPFKTSVKCLGVHVDRTLSVQQHISSISRASFLDHRRVASVRLYLSQSAAVRRVASVRLYLSQSAAVRRVASVLYLSQSAAVRRVASVRLYLSQSASKTCRVSPTVPVPKRCSKTCRVSPTVPVPKRCCKTCGVSPTVPVPKRCCKTCGVSPTVPVPKRCCKTCRVSPTVPVPKRCCKTCRVSPTVPVPKRCCRTCCGNDHILP